jgi:hypothetical protein
MKLVNSSLSFCRSICSLLTVTLLAACASETLFQSNFDPTPLGSPPSPAQQVGTINIFGPPASVIVVSAPESPGQKWVQITRPNGPDISGIQGVLSQLRGPGQYTFSTYLYFPPTSVPATESLGTIQFEPANSGRNSLVNFLHIDFMGNNQIRIDDNPNVVFGSFPRNQVFILQVSLNTAAATPTAHIVLAGAGTSGELDYAITPQNQILAKQFDGIRLWLGFPVANSYDATNILVTHATQ